ncbi:MAG: hypothetical protein ACD_71C00132G0001, partial [uncultured bacterium (gcode 4)]
RTKHCLILTRRNRPQPPHPPPQKLPQGRRDLIDRVWCGVGDGNIGKGEKKKNPLFTRNASFSYKTLMELIFLHKNFSLL